MKDNRVARLVEGGNPLVLFRDNLALLLRADTTLIKAWRISDIWMKGRDVLAAIIAASFIRFSRSAPVKPGVV